MDLAISEKRQLKMCGPGKDKRPLKSPVKINNSKIFQKVIPTFVDKDNSANPITLVLFNVQIENRYRRLELLIQRYL